MGLVGAAEEADAQGEAVRTQPAAPLAERGAGISAEPGLRLSAPPTRSCLPSGSWWAGGAARLLLSTDSP